MTKFRNIIHLDAETKTRKRELGRKGSPNLRIIKTEISNGREYMFHATKGWRSRALGARS